MVINDLQAGMHVKRIGYDGVYTIWKINPDNNTVYIQRPDDFHATWVQIKYIYPIETGVDK